jgi:hypothetical protein
LSTSDVEKLKHFSAAAAAAAGVCRSGHVKQLRKSLDEHDIIWQLSPLLKVGEQPE